MTLAQLGILMGFAAAVFQAFNYAFTKDCAEKYALKGLRQLIAVHIALGVPHVIPFAAWSLYDYVSAVLVFDLMWATVPYLIAQYLTIVTLTLTDSSVFSPLLAVKIPVLAVIAWLCYSQSFSFHQVFSICAILALGFYFSSMSGRVGLKPLCLIAVICAMYAVSDLGMAQFMRDWPTGSRVQSIAGLISYQFVLCALLSLPFLKIARFRLNLHAVWQTRWIAAAWTCSNLLFVSCFNLAGVVETSIVQSLRSVLGVIIAYLFYRQYIKDHAGFKKKLAVAAGMFTAVAVYYL